MTDRTVAGARPRRFYSYVMVGAVAFAFIGVFDLLAPIILSFLLIILVSLAVNPVILRLKSVTGGRKSATVLIASAAVASMGLTGWAFFGPMKTSVAEFSEQLPAYWELIQKPLIRMEQQADMAEDRLQAEVTTEITQAARAAGDTEAVQKSQEQKTEDPKKSDDGSGSRSIFSNILNDVFQRFSALAWNAAQIITVLFTVFFGVLFTLMNPRPIFGGMFAVMPQRHHDRALSILKRIAKFVPGWAGATLLGMLMIGLLTLLLVWPILGFTDALFLAVIAGLLECIPFLGPVIASVPALLLAVGEGGVTPIWILGAYIGVQALEGNVIMPFVMARSMRVHPVAVIFSMLLCVVAFGVLGVIVAAPLVAILGIVHDEIYRPRFLPGVSDLDLDLMARQVLGEEQPASD